MDKNLLVEIFVATGGGNGVIGTGYPVAADKILTARHVVYPDGNKSNNIKLRWYHLNDAERAWKTGEVVWESDHETDIALIEVEFPEEVKPWVYLSEEKPRDDMRWSSEGFARAGKRDEERKTIPMKGGVFSAADTSPSFVLETVAPVSNESNWRGASGSPVFVNKRIIGVVTECPANFNACRFEAIPMWRLLLDDGFRKEIKYDERKLPWRAARRELDLILDGSPKVVRQFMGNFLADVNLAEELLNSGISEVLDIADKAIADLMREDSHSAIKDVRRIVNLLLPIAFDQASINAVRAQRSNVESTTIALLAATRTLAEIIMAGVDRRTTRFRPLDSDEKLPDGELRIPLCPEVGIDENSKNAYLHAFHDYIISKFTGTETRRRIPPLARSALINIAADSLKTLSERKSQTYYFLFHLPDENIEARMIMDTMSELKRSYPSMVFLNLSADSERYIKEAKDMDLLSYIVEKAPDSNSCNISR